MSKAQPASQAAEAVSKPPSTTSNHSAVPKAATPANPDANPGAVFPSLPLESAEPSACRRETRIQATDRWRRESRVDEVAKFRQQVRDACRKGGWSKGEAMERAWAEAFKAFPPPAEEEAKPGEAAPAVSIRGESGRIHGLGSIPKAWGELPTNASLQAELGWVQANRLLVVEEQASGATTVSLAKAQGPAPSMAALGWLETSIRAYSKYVDVVARGLKDEVDEAEHVRRERMAIEDIRALLQEMMQAPGPHRP